MWLTSYNLRQGTPDGKRLVERDCQRWPKEAGTPVGRTVPGRAKAPDRWGMQQGTRSAGPKTKHDGGRRATSTGTQERQRQGAAPG